MFFQLDTTMSSKCVCVCVRVFVCGYVCGRMIDSGVPRTHLKDLLHLALDLLLLGALVRQAAHQLVYGSHNVSHFLPRNEAVAVDVVQRECPAQFLLHGATRQYRKSLNKILWQMNEKPHINKHYALHCTALQIHKAITIAITDTFNGNKDTPRLAATYVLYTYSILYRHRARVTNWNSLYSYL